MISFLRASEGASQPSSRLRRLTACSGLVSIAICLSAGSAHRAEAHPHRKSASSSSHHPALIKVSTAKLRSGPGTDKKATALLDEGRSAVVVGRKDGWVKIRLDSGREGWLRHDLVEVAKSTVHEDSGSDESTSPRKHRKHESEDDAQANAHSHRKAGRSKAEVAHIEHHAGSVHHGSRVVTALHVSAPRRTSHVTQMEVASASSDVKTIHTTELKMDGDGNSPENDAPAPIPPAPGDSEPIDRASNRGDRLVRSALAYRGTTYRMGATGNGAFDCSGFTMYLFSKEGTSLPRTAEEQYSKGEAIAKDRMQPGDLVFFRNTYKSGISHVGIYIGNGSFVHASGYGRGVRVDSLNADFYVNHWAGARRPR